MAGPRIGDGAEVAPACQALFQFRFRQKPRLPIAEGLLLHFDFPRHPGELTGLVGDVKGSGLKIAGDGMAPDAFVHEPLCLLRQVEQAFGAGGTEACHEFGGPLAQAGVELAAVAP